MTVLIAAAFILSTIDRTILVLFVEPIKHDLGVTDTEFSLLTGGAFAIFYGLCGLPLGWLADRARRVRIIGLSILIWSAMTALGGFASSFGLLFVSRIGVGAGEAGLAPASISVISDYFPREARAQPLAFISLGSSAGAGLTMIFGGALVALAAGWQQQGWPMAGLHGWQIVLLLLGVIGLLYATLFMALAREPARRENDGLPQSGGSALRIFLRSHWLLLSCLIGGQAVVQIALNAMISWLPSHLIRTTAWSASQTGYLLGTAFLIGAVFACLSVSAWLRLLRIKRVATPLPILSLLGALFAVIPSIAAPLTSDPYWTIILAAIAVYFMILAIAVSPVPIQLLAPNSLRGQIFSLQTLANAIIGTLAGPVAVAVLTDYLFHDPAKVGLSIALVSGAALPLAAWLWFGASRLLQPIDPHDYSGQPGGHIDK